MKDKIVLTDNKRSLPLDILRIIAILAVILLHSAMTFLLYEPHTSEYIWGSVFDSISRLGVPIFVMISGALMLDEKKDESSRVFLNRHIKKIVFIFIVWTGIYCASTICIHLINNESLSFENIIYSLIEGPAHMWYLYMIVGLYLATPILKKFVSVKNKRLVLYYIVIALIISFSKPFLQIIYPYFSHSKFIYNTIDGFYMDFFSGYVAYYLTGWYIFHVGIGKKKYRYILYALSIVCALTITIYVIVAGKHRLVYDNLSWFVYFYSLGIFAFVCEMLKNRTHNNAVITKLSQLSFGVYLVHMLILNLTNALMPVIQPYGIFVLLKFLITAPVSYGLCYIASKIPFIKKCIRM